MQKPFPSRRRLRLPVLFVFAAAIALAAFGFGVYPVKGTARTGAPVRIGAPEPLRQASAISPYGPGFESELVNRFCRDASLRPEWVNVPDRETGFALLQKGDIDLLVGFWGDLPENAAAADAPADDPAVSLAAGKAYAHFNPVHISGAAVPRAPGEEAAASDASGIDALTRAFSALLPALFADERETADAPLFPVFSLAADAKGDTSREIMLLDPASSALWLPFMGDVSTRQVRAPTPYRWFWRDDGAMLAKNFTAFWEDSQRAGELTELTERYFGFLPRTLRQNDIMELADTLASRLPRYEESIKKAAQETGVPPLLLVAMIYQESRFNPDAVSATRVRGIMQLTAATAKMLDVDRKDPEEAIVGGARYLRDLWAKLESKVPDEWDRWFIALAAYNQGPGNVNKAIRLSRDLGGRGNTWADLKRALPLATTFRGREAKSFVEKIRYYHFILHGLVALAPAETQNFAPLLALAAGDGGH